MDFISSSQLEQYDDIIEEINTEFEKYERLKKDIEKEHDRIIIGRLAQNNLYEKVSHVTVKCFSDVFELYNLYQSEIPLSYFHKLRQYECCKFYLIEIYITKSLHQKMVNFKWMLNISVSGKNVCVNKTVNLRNSIPILEVIPVNENVYKCTVEALLILPSSNTFTTIKLDSIKVDVSYHFSPNKERFKGETVHKKLLEVTEVYNKELNVTTLLPKTVNYEFACDISPNNFIKAVIKNCYHRLDIELFSESNNETSSVFTVQFFVGQNKHSLTYNRQSKRLMIKANLDDLPRLKKYFLSAFHNCNNLKMDRNIVLKKLKELSRGYSEDDKYNSEKVCKFYNEIRKCWDYLPL